uniref:Uncharacterized protein n=1 Tax=Oenococcus oeni TaxID=1247 RepID=C1JGW3_OENOE|nr:hypothetical protein [Oenococcus oeni]
MAKQKKRAISDIVMGTFVFIIATGFVTVVSTAVLLKRAKRAPKDAEQSHSDDDDDWKKDDWNHGPRKKGERKD